MPEKKYENYVVLNEEGEVLMVHLLKIDLYPGERFHETKLTALFKLKLVKVNFAKKEYLTENLLEPYPGLKKLLDEGIKNVMIDEIIPG